MTKIYAEVQDEIRFHYDSESDKASIAIRRKEKGGLYDVYDVVELSIEDIRTLNRYLDHVLQIKEQLKWEMERREKTDQDSPRGC